VNVLGIDTSTPASAACVLRADGEAFEVVPLPERLGERPGHASELMPAVARCVEDAGLGWAELDAIGVGVGPGPFTGLRIGVTTARALAHAHRAELRPVCSLAALAAGVAADPSLGGDRPVLPLIDARRGEVFAALHRDGTTLWEPFAAAPEAVAGRLRDDAISPLAAGDGAVRFRDVLEAAGATVPSDDSRAHVVRGVSICRLAAKAAPVPVEAVLPQYLRLPDAKPRTA
jgi:tRNA threonylcarbamoyladenosine biosynthesis protein TsaB